MKSKIIVLIILTSCIFQVNYAQNKSGFKLSGQFNGLPDGTKVYLRTQEKDTVAKTISSGDRFMFSGVLPQNGRFHFIAFDTLVSKVKSNAIFLVNSEIDVTGILGKREVIVKGSRGHLEYNDIVTKMIPFDSERKELSENLLKVYKSKNDFTSIIEFNQREVELRRKLDSIVIKRSEFGIKWIADHLTSLYAPYMIIGYKEVLGATDFQKLFDVLTPSAKASYYGMQLENIVKNLNSRGALHEGGTIPNFSIITANGEKLFIKDLASQNKFTLIDCWASWCGPCRAEIPHLKSIYNLYKDKGLSIVGVSSDKITESWKKALKEDATSWTQGIENIESPVATLFDLKAIPAYILIDSNGKLIAFDCAMSSIPNFGGSLRGESLGRKLVELFDKKEY